MSGGTFDYQQYLMAQIADGIREDILRNDDSTVDEYGQVRGNHFSEETLAEFIKGEMLLRKALVYVNRIDYLLAGDDGEESFHRRLKEELDAR